MLRNVTASCFTTISLTEGKRLLKLVVKDMRAEVYVFEKFFLSRYISLFSNTKKIRGSKFFNFQSFVIHRFL